MVLYIGIYIESDWLYHAEWVALSNGQSGSELAEYSYRKYRFIRILLRDVSIPKLGATAPVLGIKKPSPIDDYTEYWV